MTLFFNYPQISLYSIIHIIQFHFCGYEIINHEAVDTHILPKKVDYTELKKHKPITVHMYLTLLNTKNKREIYITKTNIISI